jgi:hypothetical protein
LLLSALAGNILNCNLTLANTGNVRLSNITAGGHAITCAMRHPTLLSPGASFFCTLSRFILQDDFELGNVDLSFPIGASALGLVSTLIDPQPSAVYNVKLPQRPVLELVTSLSTGFVTWPGDLVTYSVELINRGNVHLKAVNLHPVTNSSTDGMNTTFPMDCGVAGTLPRQILVEDSFTCSHTIEFTTPVSLYCLLCKSLAISSAVSVSQGHAVCNACPGPGASCRLHVRYTFLYLCRHCSVQVIRAGNMTVRLTGSATNLPVPAVGPPLVVMTPTCENRSTRE